MSDSPKHVGRALPHESAEAHVRGSALYTDDIALRTPGVLHAYPACADVAHGWLDRLEIEDAVRIPGVVRVLTAADVPGENDTGANRHDEPLFPRPVQAPGSDPRPEILYHSMPLAWVIAESYEVAKQGALAVRAHITERPAILDIESAIRAGSVHSEVERIRRGEPEDAIRSAPHSLKGELEVGGQEHFYLETQSSFAYLDEAGSMMVHSSTQHPTETQEIVARVLGTSKNQVIVQQLRMGGAFGGKETQANPFAAIAALAAYRTERPVRVRLDRAKDVLLTGKRHPFLGTFEAGFDREGRILGLVLELRSDGGWSLDLSLPVLGRALFHSDNAYFLPNVEVRGQVMKTHKTSMTAFRGFGGPQGMLMIEEVIDRIARTLNLPPEEVRKRNFYRAGQSTHYEQVIEDARIHRIVAELETESTFAERRAELREWNRKTVLRKRGIALTPVKFGISFTAKFFNQAGALVLVYKDGSVQVNHGGTEMGQGLHTKMLQVAADGLGLPLERVRLMPTRTDKVPNTSATAASSGSDLNGAAIEDACNTLRSRLAQVASRLLSCDADDVRFQGGRVFSAGHAERSIGFDELVSRAYDERIQLSATGFYRTPDIHYDRDQGRGKPFHYFAWGAAVSEVEVDGATGMYELRRVDIVHDVGSSLSPLIDLGQIEGGFAQGAGWLTQEALVWDQRGVLRTSNASTYKLPTLGECPPVFNVRLLRNANQEGVVQGSKAIGEPPLMLAISVREALRDAVAAFGPADRRAPIFLPSPATAEAVFWAIESIREEATPRVSHPGCSISDVRT